MNKLRLAACTLFCFYLPLWLSLPSQAQAASSQSANQTAPLTTSGTAQRNLDPRLPTLFVVGDSTANNADHRGWGDPLADYFDLTRINVVNRARGGRSSRTFVTEGLWDGVRNEIKPGDFVLIQFGHNDGGPPDKDKARGSLPGVGEESQELTMPNGSKEVVYTFGWYMRKFVTETKAKGATAIVLSPTVRNIWKDGKVERSLGHFGEWSAGVAQQTGVSFVDLSTAIADQYEKMGQQKVSEFFPQDHTHTSAAGADLNASLVVGGLKGITNSPLANYLSEKGKAQPAYSSPASSAGESESSILAATPPMGWNSWDSYGTTVQEADIHANAEWMAQHLKPYGWQYVVVDMEWFVTNPTPYGNSKNSQFSLDEYGRYTPALNRFPSSKEKGFAPLAEFVHSLGLKFGIHILSGIPKLAVEKNLPIHGSSYQAAEAADTSQKCPWNPDNYGIDSVKPAGQAYYDSIAELYASWGVDFIKVDCIASRPYRGDDIRMLSEAIRKTGRPIGMSLSPGAAPLDKVEEMRKYAQMWRISDDVWDMWHSTVSYPQGLGDQFPRAAQWAALSEAGHWPDADMLPLGYLGPAPGWGKARATRLTHDEQQTLMTLWSMFRSPLMVGGNLPQSDEWTTSLLTNPEVLAVDQSSTGNHVVTTAENRVIWTAQGANGQTYLAIFNLSDAPQKVSYRWKDLGLPEEKYKVRDLWLRKDIGSEASAEVTLGPHGCVLYELRTVAL